MKNKASEHFISSVDVLAILGDAANHMRIGLGHLPVGERTADEIDAVHAAIAELMEAVRPRVAGTYEDAARAHAQGVDLVWCKTDALNPCWMPGMSMAIPLRHWAWTAQDAPGKCLACADCRLRAALARCGPAA